MAVADGAGDPAQAVIVPGADVGVLPFRVCGFFIYGHAEYVAVPPQLSAVTVYVQGQVAFLVILEGLCIAQLVGSLTDFTETVVAVLHRVAVAVCGFADLSGGGVFIALSYAVRKADTCDAPLAVHIIRAEILFSINDTSNLPSGIVFILLDGAPTVPAFSTLYILNLFIQFVSGPRYGSKGVFLCH